MKERPYIRPSNPIYNKVVEVQKQRKGQRVFYVAVDPSEQPIDLDPTLHTVEIDMANGTLLPVETNIIPPSTPQINDALNNIENQITLEDNEN